MTLRESPATFLDREPLFSFKSHADWVRHATKRFDEADHTSRDTICIDAKGRIVISGGGFRAAEASNAFPVNCYSIRP